MANFENLLESVISGNANQVKSQVQNFIDFGVSPLDIINQGLVAGMNVVGARFKAGDMYVPEVLMAAKAMATGIEMVKPLIGDKDMPSFGKVAVGTVKGDLHDIGKNLVGMLLESSGFTVVNLGVDIDAAKFVQAVKEQDIQIIGLSALLTTTMMAMKDVVDLLVEEGLRDKVKVIVGGAPISQEFSDKIGADGFAPDAAAAVDLCKKLLGV